jgi:AraC family transcriptional regulator
MADCVRGVHRIRHRASWFVLGEFRCPSGHRAWRKVNRIGHLPLIAFPHTAVAIDQRGREPVVATPNHAVFYDAGQEYRRELRDARGDECVWIALRAPALERLVEGINGSGRTRGGFRFPFVAGPSSAQTFLLHRGLLSHLDVADEPDGLLIEETVTGIVDEALRGAFAVRGARTSRRAARARHALAERAKELLVARAETAVSLDDIARELHCSRFHLARTFRAETGFALYEYRNQLRLRNALDRLAERTADLSRLALELGYSSHSHFANSFKCGFGLAPSAVRRAFAEPEGLRVLVGEAPRKAIAARPNAGSARG